MIPDRILLTPRFTVSQQPYAGLMLDRLNNEIPAWDTPTDVKVYGWQISTEQQRGDYTSRHVIRVDLYPPPDLLVGIRDRFILDGEDYEVDEIADYTHGHHGWPLGRVVKLVRITPKGIPA